MIDTYDTQDIKYILQILLNIYTEKESCFTQVHLSYIICQYSSVFLAFFSQWKHFHSLLFDL